MDGIGYRFLDSRTINQPLQLRQILSAGAFRLREYELPCMRCQDCDHFLKLLVGHDTENDPDAFRMKLSKECRQRSRDDAGLIGISDVHIGVAGVRVLAGVEEPFAGAVSRQREEQADKLSK